MAILLILLFKSISRFWKFFWYCTYGKYFLFTNFKVFL